MHRGFVKLWRKSTDHGLLKNPHAFTLWCYLLMKASHKKHQHLVGNKVVELEPGQLVIGRKALARELNQNEAKIRRGLALLENMGNVTIKTTNKYSIVTVVNWSTYQNRKDESDQQSGQQAANRWPTSGQQTATNKNEENYKEHKEQEEEVLSSFFDLVEKLEGQGYGK